MLTMITFCQLHILLNKQSKTIFQCNIIIKCVMPYCLKELGLFFNYKRLVCCDELAMNLLPAKNDGLEPIFSYGL